MTVPSLSAPVNDYANILSHSTIEKLNTVLRRQWEGGGSQLTILTVPSLEGMPIEEYSIKVVESWQLGTKSKDNGVLFLLAMKDRKMRIEVGQGLEGVLPDAYARRILDNEVTPYMKRGEYDQAVISGVVGILEKTDPQLVEQNTEVVAHEANGKQLTKNILFIVFIIIWFIFSLLRRLFGFGHRRHGFGRGVVSGAVLGGLLGSGRKSGWGGGGWSGGGGGFSGGGSSGSW